MNVRGINITEGNIRHSDDIDRYYSGRTKIAEKFYVKKGDMVIGMDGSKVGKNVAIVSEVDADSILIQRVARVRHKKNADICFIYQKVFSSGFHKYVDAVNTSSAIPHISLQQIRDYSIGFPPLPEQQKIASFLTAIDAKIELLIKKKALLEQYKKGIMQQLFSQQIRFKDDEGNEFPEWEERELGVGLVESRIVGSKGDKAKKITVKLWGKGVFEKNEATEGSENTQYYYRSAGQLIYSKLDFLNCAFGIIPEYLDGFQTTLDLPTFDIDHSIFQPEYLLARITRKDFYKQFGDTADGSRKAKRIHPKDFLSFSIPLPSLLEQQKIVIFLNSLEAKTNVLSQQIELTKSYKKSLLQQLFV